MWAFIKYSSELWLWEREEVFNKFMYEELEKILSSIEKYMCISENEWEYENEGGNERAC